MHRIIIVLGWIVAATNTLGAQVELDKALLHLEKQIYYSANDSAAANLRLAKFNTLLSHSRYEEALLTSDEVESKWIGDSAAKVVFFWNASLLHFLSGQINKADYYNRQYYLNAHDTSIAQLEMRALISAQVDTVEFSNCIDSLQKMDAAFADLECYSSLIEHKAGNSIPYVIASALLPGSGMIAAGYPIKGITAMGLTATSVWAVSSMLQHALYFNAAAYFLMAGIRFYLGNLTLTESLYMRHEEKKIAKESSECQQHFDGLMKKYPINFR